MKKILLSAFALVLSFVAMAQEEGVHPAVNLQGIGLSLTVDDDKESIIEVGDKQVTYKDLEAGTYDTEILNDLSEFKIRNNQYMVLVTLAEYSENFFSQCSTVYVPYLMSHINNDIPGSRALSYTLSPNYDTYEDINMSKIQYSGYFKEEGTEAESTFMCFDFVYLRAIGAVAIIQIYGNPDIKEDLLNYTSYSINFKEDFFTGKFLSKEELAANDDGPNFIQRIVHIIQSQSSEDQLIAYGNTTIGSAYYSYNVMLGHNAPSYTGQDNVLSKDEKKKVKQSTLETRQQYEERRAQEAANKPAKQIIKAGGN